MKRRYPPVRCHDLSRLLVGVVLILSAGVHAQSERDISADFPYESHFVDVLDSRMHYVEEGQGEVILFIHGNPTSSYLWRNIIPHVSDDYRAIAVDLIGMGRSGKPDIDYTYQDHRRYLNAFIDALDLRDITFVIHDWGTVLGFDHAMQHPDNVRGIAFMEALLPPSFPVAEEPPAESIFGRLRREGEGERLIYEDHYFMEEMLPGGVIRELSETEMDHYRRPYREEGTRRPILQWPRELPMGGNPARNVEVITDIGDWMQETDMPMLYLWASGREEIAAHYTDQLQNIETHYLGDGRHYLQEDHPKRIGRAVNDWRRRISQ